MSRFPGVRPGEWIELQDKVAAVRSPIAQREGHAHGYEDRQHQNEVDREGDCAPAEGCQRRPVERVDAVGFVGGEGASLFAHDLLTHPREKLTNGRREPSATLDVRAESSFTVARATSSSRC